MEAQPTAQQVGHTFVGQFYTVLHQNPESVHRFYQDDSTMSRPALDGSLTTVTTMKDINDFILSLDCTGYMAEIMNADAQFSYKDGVIVLVTGCLTGKDNIRRKFTQSFFLAPQSTGYYVLNDAFRFIDEDGLTSSAPVEVNESDKNATATSAKEPELADVPDKSLPILTDAGNSASNGNSDACQRSEDRTIEEAVVVKPPFEPVKHIDDQVVVESSSDVIDAEKKSYASIVKNRKDGMLTTPVCVPSTTVKKLATNNGHHSRGTLKSVPKPQENGSALPAGQKPKEAAVSTNVAESSAPNGNNTKQHGNNSDNTKVNADRGYSIYIGNLPCDATVAHVEHAFKKFGPIKHGGVQVKCSKGFGFGFVEYESLSSVQKALEASPLRIGDYDAHIEEKKTTGRVVDGSVVYPSGRGGYRNDGFRGRGNFSGGHGYGRNDYGRRDYGNGGRGDYGNGARSGDGYNRVYQNGGGGSRTLQQGGTK